MQLSDMAQLDGLSEMCLGTRASTAFRCTISKISTVQPQTKRMKEDPKKDGLQ
jgi:hypothetical protein